MGSLRQEFGQNGVVSYLRAYVHLSSMGASWISEDNTINW